ncbi:uncharacterized protein LOC143723500 [Siphateles boraxobius]|uniref:uncharacterized protein LOC143723500 n=1 Tax=Siphateles boraxobius TaxID=180520 RepID=UPI0040643FD3
MDRVLLKSKTKLIRWLKLDCILILQHVQEHEFITSTEYENLKSMKVPTEVVIKLLDIIYGKGENVCRDFLNLLKNDDVNEFSPELREWIKTVDTSETANTAGQSGIQVTIQKPDRDWERRENGNRSIQDYQKFLKANTSQLVQKVKNIDPIIDDLDLHNESVANVRACPTRQMKMRELLDCVNCESIAKDLVNALFKHEESLMKGLQ